MSDESHQEEVWDAERCGKALGVSARQALKLAQAGRLPHFKVGRWVRFDPEAVKNWKASGGAH